MELTRAELAEAARMIQAQSPHVRWAMSYGNTDSVWIVELESSTLEICVGYWKRQRICYAWDARAPGAQYPRSLTRDPAVMAALRKYGWEGRR